MNERQRYGAWSESERAHFRQSGYWVDQPLGEQLRQWARQQPEQIALVSGQQRLDYVGLDDLADRLAAGLAARGIRSGDNVLLQLPNCIGLVATLFALFRLGARPILAMPGQKSADIDALCHLAEPEAWLYPEHYLGNDYQALVKDIAAKYPAMQCWPVNTQDETGIVMATFQAEAQRFSPPYAEDIALLLLSGGSTGTPKLIPRTHADYLYNARQMAEICHLSDQSVYLATLAVAHNFTLSCPGVLGTLLSGGKVVLAQTSGCDEIFPLIAQEKVTFTALVPPLVNLWLECRAWDDSDLSSLQLIQVGGARLESTLAQKVKPAFNCQLQQVFGMAEGLICCTRLDDPEEVILQTQGRPISDADQVRVVDPEGLPVSSGCSGELLTHGPYTIGGYYRAEAQNLQAFTPDKFYRSGDIVRLTEAGNIVVEGRLKELINRAGEKIGCAEIESFIDMHPEVASCVVVGVPDERLGERICACIIGDAKMTLPGLRSYLQQKKLSDHKLPDQLLCVTSWPLTAVGKIDKRQLVNTASLQAKTEGDFSHTMTVNTTPLDIIYHLLSHESDCHIAYERDGIWDIGIDSQAQIALFIERAELVQPGAATQIWQSGNWQANLQQALDALPFSDWQAYGVSHFEFSRLIHDVLPKQLPESTPLLTLFIPRVRIRLSESHAEIFTTSSKELPQLINRVQAADRVADISLPDANWQATIAKRIREQDAHDYCQRVANAVKEIQQGKYQKIILSRRITLQEPVDLLASYHLGRRNNTPARSFVAKVNDDHFIGFSPETVVEVSSSGVVSTQPLAGTRALTADEAENQRLREVLTNDTKEIAEHAVSVKLAVDELRPLCENDSTHVSDFMQVSLRGSVQHLASRVRGQLRAECDAWDAFGALFPAVTASGIPKRPAIEAIQRLEPMARGAYSGSVFMINSLGEKDAALVLRSLYQHGESASLQAGAGIIDQSLPERELEETIEKLQSVSRFIITR